MNFADLAEHFSTLPPPDRPDNRLVWNALWLVVKPKIAEGHPIHRLVTIAIERGHLAEDMKEAAIKAMWRRATTEAKKAAKRA